MHSADSETGNKLLSLQPHNISHTFHQNILINNRLPDLTILSSDGILFYTHKHRLQRFSNFYSAVTKQNIRMRSDPSRDVANIALPESSNVISILLHVAYGYDQADFLALPSLDDTLDAVVALQVYGFVPLDQFITPTSVLFQLLTHHASLPDAASDAASPRPSTSPALVIYTLAAKHGLHELAVAVSSYLLSYPLHNLTDADAVEMGPVYLRRLFLLHFTRANALKSLLSEPPCSASQWFEQCASSKHTCDLNELDKMTRAWALASSYIILNGNPDMDAHSLDGIFRPLGEDLSCNGCRRLWAERVYKVVTNYGSLKDDLTPPAIVIHGVIQEALRAHKHLFRK